MRRVLPIIIIVLFFFTLPSRALAASAQAYQDYLYQFDLYRQKYADFSVAKTEYEKFKSLTSLSDALEKTKAMMAQRDILLKTYLFLLNEKLNEDRGLSTVEKQLYQTLIANEVKFLDNHSQLVPSIGTLNDAVTVSRQLEDHYVVLHGSMRQIISGLTLGSLGVLSGRHDSIVRSAQTLVNASRGIFTLPKQSTIDRWLLQIQNKKSLYQQKIDSIISANTQLRGNSIDEIDRAFAKIQTEAADARQELQESSSFLTELMTALRFQD